LVLIGEDVIRNPSSREVDSLLKIYKKPDIDSVAVIAVTNDSAYAFPLTNYASSLRETRVAGDNSQVSEVTRQSDDKILYKLKIDENALRRRNVSATPTAYMKRLMEIDKISKGQEVISQAADTTKKEDIFQNEFKEEKRDTSSTGRDNGEPGGSTVLTTAKLFPYKPLKFATDYIVAGFNNSVLGSRFQLYQGGAGPITLSSNTSLDGTLRLGTADIMEDIKISGGYRLSSNLKDNDWLLQFNNLRKRIDWSLTYYRNVQETNYAFFDDSVTTNYPGRVFSNLYQAGISYPFDVTKSVRISIGARKDRVVASTFDTISLKARDISKTYGLLHVEYVYDNTLAPAQNIWNGIRYKVYIDWNSQLNKLATTEGRYTFNFGFDARAYYPIYRNFIWAGRVAADFSWGNQKLIYYLGGIDNWVMLGNNAKRDGSYRYFKVDNIPDHDVDYAFQSLAVNLRGYIQNAANGNNAGVINSEFRLPVFTTLFSKPINNAFIRNFQLIQFIDLGSAWNGKYDKLSRPTIPYTQGPVTVNIKAPGVGPFIGGYGFGARSTLLGYFLKLDAGWQMNGFFKGNPIYYFSMGLDF
jgi:hypothetical protein